MEALRSPPMLPPYRFLMASLAVVFSLPLDLRAETKTPSLAGSVQPFVDRQELAGAVMLVADKDKILTTETVGSADIAANRPMTGDAMFWIASQSKPITCAAIMMLVEEGKIHLNDPVEDYLPEFKGQMVVSEKSDEKVVLVKPDHPITVREVLSHTSGLPFKSGIEEPTLDRWPLEARVRSYAMTPLDFEPSSAYRYANAGINTGARILEVVSEMPYEKFLQERLFDPLGMSDTTFWPTEEQAKRIATSYQPGPEKQGLEPTVITQLHYPLTDREVRYPMPAGGLFSTAHDLSRFYRMLLNGGELDGKRLLSEESVKTLTSRQTPEGLSNSYGLGFKVDPHRFGHAGAYSTNSFADTEHGLILIWLVQHAGFPGEGGKAQDAFVKAAIASYGN
ncbi:MAG: beta-lactamase family protein [Verrucomicrobiae bacterium]|nr:beta-lactamase family protein [Verrucomicrobiae bacterium]